MCRAQCALFSVKCAVGGVHCAVLVCNEQSGEVTPAIQVSRPQIENSAIALMGVKEAEHSSLDKEPPVWQNKLFDRPFV